MIQTKIMFLKCYYKYLYHEILIAAIGIRLSACSPRTNPPPPGMCTPVCVGSPTTCPTPRSRDSEGIGWSCPRATTTTRASRVPADAPTAITTGSASPSRRRRCSTWTPACASWWPSSWAPASSAASSSA